MLVSRRHSRIVGIGRGLTRGGWTNLGVLNDEKSALTGGEYWWGGGRPSFLGESMLKIVCDLVLFASVVHQVEFN